MDFNNKNETSKEEHMEMDGEEEKEAQIPEESKLKVIKNKIRREMVYKRCKEEKKKAKQELKKLKKKEKRLYGNDEKKAVIHTIESKREKDETVMDNEDTDLIAEEATDQYADYYSKKYAPKILITSSDIVHGKTISFMRQLGRLIPNSAVLWRKKASVKKKIEVAIAQGFTDMIVINEDSRRPDGLLVIHLLGGPTALFRLSNVKTCKQLKKKNSAGNLQGHRPELILNNFKTRLGRSIGRMFGALFHYNPEFKGRSVVTFHNQRDYIFFRHHRYQFKNAQKVNLNELGPSFTLRLEWLREGVFEGDFEWTLKRREMETSRLKFHL